MTRALVWMSLGAVAALTGCTTVDTNTGGGDQDRSTDGGRRADQGEAGAAGDRAEPGNEGGQQGNEGGAPGSDAGAGAQEPNEGGTDGTESGGAGPAEAYRSSPPSSLNASEDPEGEEGFEDPGHDPYGNPELANTHETDSDRAAARAIQEADIIQIRNTTLFAMSAVGGLAVIDVSEQDKLTLLGHYRTEEAAPFEMYVRGDTVIGLFQGAPACDENGYYIGETSRVISLDVSDPADIKELGRFDLPGDISDSRVVGQILYAVSHQVGNCWDCGSNPTITVVSLDVSTPAEITEVDRLSLADSTYSWSSESRATAHVTDERMYLASVATSEASTIHVVDITDTAGDIEEVATVDVKGAIFNRWQMDEYESVLRVISQPPSWDLSLAPVVQTFSIDQDPEEEGKLIYEELGETELVLPRPEQLRSVRFDGPRAYAITFERTDPLFTIDLERPELPIQRGELEMPGWVYHMEPMGDRLLGLGFDNGNTEGSLNVSLFDVSDLENPEMLDRVNFGGEWNATVAEDQDRVHKLFNVLESQLGRGTDTEKNGLILVPYSGWTSAYGCGEYASGIQLIEFAAHNVNNTDNRDELILRGMAQSTGTSRRAFLFNERLFGVSEREVQVFNIDDLDDPQETATLALASRVHRTVPVGDKLLRISSDWWTRTGTADVVPLDEATAQVTGGSIDLANEVYGDSDSSDACYYYDEAPFRDAPAFVFGDHHVALVVSHSESYWDGTKSSTILSIDVSGNKPVVAKALQLDYAPAPSLVGANVEKVGDALVIRKAGDDEEHSLEVFDFSDPADFEHVASLDRPGSATQATGLFAQGTETLSGYYDRVDDEEVEYYLDRIDFSDPGDPDPADAVSTPGLLIGPAGEDYLSVQFNYEEEPTYTDSYYCEAYGGQWSDDTCYVAEKEFQLLELAGGRAESVSSQTLDSRQTLKAIHIGDERFFMAVTDSASYQEKVYVLGIDDGALESDEVAIGWGATSMRAQGQRLYFLEYNILSSVDASDPRNPDYENIATLAASATHLSLVDNMAIVSLGDYGVETVTLD